MMNSQFSGLNTASSTVAVVGMPPVLNDTAKTTNDARPHNNSKTTITMMSIIMLFTCDSQQVSELPMLGVSPRSMCMLTSYKPIAKNGPMSKQPEIADKVYSGLLLKTANKMSAISQKHTP